MTTALSCSVDREPDAACSLVPHSAGVSDIVQVKVAELQFVSTLSLTSLSHSVVALELADHALGHVDARGDIVAAGVCEGALAEVDGDGVRP